MIKLVHWRNMVEPEFLKTFTEIVREMVIFESNPNNLGKSSEGYLKKKFNPIDVDTTRWLLRSIKECGYEIRNSILRKHGWYRPHLDKSGALKFDTTADLSKTEFISKKEYHDFVEDWERKMEEIGLKLFKEFMREE